MAVVLTHGAGLAVHHKPVMACRVTPDALGQQADGRMEGQELGTRTRDVLAGSDGLSEAGVTPVAMARTGAYGQPVDTLLEGPCPVGLGNAAPVKHVPGRQTDRAAARWLAQLRRQGGRPASCIPPAEPRDLRARRRDRTTLVPERSREGTRGQGVLARAPSKLASGASTILGGAGRALLAALLAGRAAPVTRAAWATGRLRRQRPVLEQALPGWVRAHPRRVVAMPLAHLDGLAEPLDALRAASARRLPELRATPPTPRRRPPRRPPLTVARAVTVLDAMPGVNPRGGALWVAESGMERARCGTAARLAAWRGVAPGHDERAGQQRSGKTRHGNRALRTGLTQWAPAAAGPQDTALAALSHRLAARRGQTRAIMAVAHSIVVSACYRLSRNESSHE